MVKPFSARELSLRVRAVLRRSEATGARDLAGVRQPAHRSRARFRAWVDDGELDLTLLEFKLLLRPLREPGPRADPRASSSSGPGASGVSITTRTVDTHVKRLRDKLGSAGEYVQTVRGIGYRFAAAPFR